MKYLFIFSLMLFLFSCSNLDENSINNLETKEIKNPKTIKIPVSDNSPNL